MPPPYHEYVLYGSITRPGGASRQNFVVSLVGRFGQFDPDSSVSIEGSLVRHASPAIKTITDTSGSFYLDIQSNVAADSIAILIGAADKPTFVSPFIAIPTSRAEITEQTVAQMHGCHGCESVEPAQTYLVGYRYQFPSQSVAVPY